MTTQCPNCSAVWTMEEIDEQHCGACGYPDNQDDSDNDDYFDGSDDDYDRPNNYEQAEMMHRIQRDLK